MAALVAGGSDGSEPEAAAGAGCAAAGCAATGCASGAEDPGALMRFQVADRPAALVQMTVLSSRNRYVPASLDVPERVVYRPFAAENVPSAASVFPVGPTKKFLKPWPSCTDIIVTI